jgi:carbonic anhydrase
MNKYLIIFGIFSLFASLAVGDLIDYRLTYTKSSNCRMGRLQSPLNLSIATSTYNSTVFPVYLGYFTMSGASLVWSNDRRILQVRGNGSDNFGYINLQRRGVVKKYALKYFEINSPAEHILENGMGDLEVKLIHEKVISFQTTVNQFRNIPDSNNYLVISLLYKSGGLSSDDGFLNTIVNTWSGRQNSVKSVDLNLNSFDIIYDRQFFFYEGAFTAAPCDENANYIVINDFFKISDDTLKQFKDIYNSVYINGFTTKEPATYYGRPVFRNFAITGVEASSSFTKLSCILILAFLILI